MGGILCDAFPQQNKISCQEKKKRKSGNKRAVYGEARSGAGKRMQNKGGRFFFSEKSGRRDPCWKVRGSLMRRFLMVGEQENVRVTGLPTIF